MDPPPREEEVEVSTPKIIQEELDARLAELKTQEIGLKQEYKDLKKVCNPIPEEDIHGFMFGLLKVGRERTNAYKKAYESVLALHQKSQADDTVSEKVNQALDLYKAVNEEISRKKELICCRRRREDEPRREDQEPLPNFRSPNIKP